MARRMRIRKLREELDELEELQHGTDRTEKAVEEKDAEKQKDPQADGAAALQTEDPVARTLELQKTAGNKAVGAAIARWPTLGAPPAAQWPKQLEMIIDGKTVIPLESAQMGTSGPHTSSASVGANRERAEKDESGEIVVTLKQGKWSTDLFRESLSGSGYKMVEIVFPGKDGKGVRVILADVLISGWSMSGHGSTNDDSPMESISLNFKKRTFSQDPPPARGR
jgi:Type VI secretion system effector, Hcp